MAIRNIRPVKRCGRLLTMHMGPDNILVNMDVEFVDGLSTDEVEDAIDLIESRIRAAVPEVKRIYIEAEGVKMRFSKEKFGYICSSGTPRASNCL